MPFAASEPEQVRSAARSAWPGEEDRLDRDSREGVVSLRKPNREDRRRLHAAINQRVAQRFLLTLVATVLSQLGLVYLITSETLNLHTFAISILMLLGLSMLYFISHCLKCAIQRHATYLRLTGASRWERHLAAYDLRFRTRMFTIPHAAIFMGLGALAGLWPFIPLGKTSGELSILRLLLLLATVGYAALVVGLAWRYRAEVADRLEQQWKEILANDKRVT